MKIEILLHMETESSLTKEDLKKKVIIALKCCFEIVTDKYLEFRLENNDIVKASYFISQYEVSANGIESALCYLTIESEQKGMRCAKALDRADELLQQGMNKGTDRFLIVTISDDRSKFFAIKAYPFFCDFETKLRCLILKLLTKSFGILWAQETLSQEMEAKLKQRLKGADYRKLAKEAIYEMDFNMLETYLFSKYRKVQPEEIIDNLLTEDNLSKLSIADIKGLVAQARPKSLWERYFSSDVAMPELEKKLSEIRISRNKIAHNKRYELRDYKKDRLLLGEFCKQIDIAIDRVEVKPLDPREAVVTVDNFLSLDFPGLKAFAESLRIISEGIGPISEKLNASMQRIAQVMSAYDSKIDEVCAGLSNTLKYFLPILVDTTFSSDKPAEELPESIEPEKDTIDDGCNSFNEESYEVKQTKSTEMIKDSSPTPLSVDPTTPSTDV